MKLYNLKDHNEQVSFAQAIKQGPGKQQGLFFPLELPEFELTEIDQLLGAGLCHPQQPHSVGLYRRRGTGSGAEETRAGRL